MHESTGDRYRLHWEGDAVPHRMKEVAVAHDEGKKVRAVTIKLNLADAKVWKLGEKTRRNTDRRSNHDTDKYGIRYPRPRRRSHNRLCASDLTPTDRLALAAT